MATLSSSSRTLPLNLAPAGAAFNADRPDLDVSADPTSPPLATRDDANPPALSSVAPAVATRRVKARAVRVKSSSRGARRLTSEAEELDDFISAMSEASRSAALDSPPDFLAECEALNGRMDAVSDAMRALAPIGTDEHVSSSNDARSIGARRVGILDSGSEEHLSALTTVHDEHTTLEVTGFDGKGDKTTTGRGSLGMRFHTSDGDATLILSDAHRIDIPEDLISLGKLIKDGCEFHASSPHDMFVQTPCGTTVPVSMGDRNSLMLEYTALPCAVSRMGNTFSEKPVAFHQLVQDRYFC